VGIPLPGAEVAVVDVDAGPVADGADGEIVARGPQVFAGYLHAAATEAFVGDGWFRTGDVGRVDPVSGYLTITGRAKDLIITGGLNVYPREVELALEALPQVASAAVVGVPSECWGEEVTAFIVPADGCAPGTDDLRAAAAELLAAYKRPKAFHLVEALPRNHMGKVLREVLVEHAMGTLDEGT
jgi:malonyl-CoA/methylmalonyl-CoA synthetase